MGTTAFIARLLAATLLSGPALAAPPTFQVSDLGLPPGYREANPADINDRGQVLGVLTPDDTGQQYRPFLWSAATGIQVAGPEKRTVWRDLGALDNRGHVVGSRACPSCGGGEGFVWKAGTRTRSLTGLYADADANARSINADGTVVGDSYAENSLYHVVTWSVAEGIVDRHPPGLYMSQGVDINDHGQITGWMQKVIHDGTTGFVIEPDGTWTDLGGLFDGGSCCDSYPREINAQGHVVGAASLPSTYRTHAFIWTPTDGMRDMAAGSPYSNWYSDSTDINASGQAVGIMYDDSLTFAGFYWDDTNGLHRLDALIDPADPWAGRVVLDNGRGINRQGQIAASGVVDGVRRVFLLTPVP